MHRVLPALYKEFVNAPMVPFVLPSVLQVSENGTPEEFREHILPNLKPVLTLEDPPQVFNISHIFKIPKDYSTIQFSFFLFIPFTDKLGFITTR